MASWQSPGSGPARPLTVTLAPRAQLGSRPEPWRRDLGLAWGWREWKQQSRPWLAGWPAGWSAADLGNVSHLSWLAGTQHPAWHPLPLPLASCLAPLPCVPGWAGSVPPSWCGGSALSPEPGSLFVPGAGSGWAPYCPQLAVFPQPPLLPGSPPLALSQPLSFPGPTSVQEQVVYAHAPLMLQSFMPCRARNWTRATSVSPSVSLSLHLLFLPFLLSTLLWQSLRIPTVFCANEENQPLGLRVAGDWASPPM